MFLQWAMHSHSRFQMFNIFDSSMEKFTVSLEKFNITILVISLIAIRQGLPKL